MRRSKETIVTALLVLAEVAILLVAERRTPARRPFESRATRLARNGVLGGLAVATTMLLEAPVAMRVATLVERRGWGLLPRLHAPRVVRGVLAVALLDYGIYAWHVATHRVPLLWRLHLVHHADRECDVTTALRIHAFEIALSVAVRVAQICVLGVDPREFTLWQRLFGLSVIFHHADVTLPAPLERALGAVIMTPRRHGIHHLGTRDAQHANWSAGLILWDRLHRTLREGDPGGAIGVPAYRADTDVTLAKMLALPFVPQRDPWTPR